MSLEQAIHQRWADNAALSMLLPLERFTTGRSAGDEKPYATMHSLKRRPKLPTNAGNAAEEVTLYISVWHDDFDLGEQIVEHIQAVFDRATFNLPDDSAVVRMREVSMSSTHKKDGDWRWKVELLARICAPLDGGT